MNGRILASRIRGERAARDMGTCPRCGVTRKRHTGANRTGLCMDCSRSMTPEEREEWKK